MTVAALLLALAAARAPIEAHDAVLRGSTLVYVTATGDALVGMDVPSGEERWRTPLGAPASAALVTKLDGAAVLVQAAGTFTAVDSTSGAVLQRREAPRGWRFLHRGMGGCALVTDCELQPIDCADGLPLGEALHAPTFSFWIDGEHTDPTCGYEPRVLASAAGTTVVWDPGGDGSELAGRTRTGESWRSAAPSCDDCEPLGAGAAPDGSVCWTTHRQAKGQVRVRAFACTTGDVRFERTVPVTSRGAYVGVVTGWWPEGLLVMHREGAVALDLASGAERWQKRLAAGQLVQVEGLRLPSWPLDLSATALVTVDGESGDVVARRPVPDGHQVHIVDQAWAIQPGGPRAGGRAGGDHAPLVHFGFDRQDAGSTAMVGGRAVARWPGDAWVIGELVRDDGRWLVVNEVTKGTDRVHVLRDDHPLPAD